ncbi:MAG: hypothetical protein EXS14_05860 [Planctomycetes bacterium]|nr:hypothetical protein [Planctomycetota bacterium]
MAQRRVASRIALLLTLMLALAAWVFLGWRLLLPPLEAELPQERTRDMVHCESGLRTSSGPEAVHSVAAFWIDRFEATRHDYALFLADNPICVDAARGLTVQDLERQPDLPVTRVTLEEARLFALYARKRLPTLMEWEWAAAGPANLQFPWGDAESMTPLANTLEAGLEALAPVGMFEGGRSRFGAYDLVGNAAEWTNSPAGLHSPDRYLIKGGSYLDPARDRSTLLTALDSWTPLGAGWLPIPWRLAGSEAWFSDTGFRCALEDAAVAQDIELRTLVSQLGARDPWGWFFDRRGAESKLRALGVVALPYLEYAMRTDNAALAERLLELAQAIRRGEH